VNGMKKAARIGKMIAIIFILIAFIGACFHYVVVGDGSKKSDSGKVVLATAQDYKGAVASINNSKIIASLENNRNKSVVTTRSDTREVKKTNVPSVVESIEQEIQEEICKRGRVNLDEKVDRVIDILENEGKTDVLDRYLGNDEYKEAEELKKKDYLRAYIKASYSTMFPKLDSFFSELNGIIKIKRNDEFLEFKKYDEFVGLVNNNDSEAEECFTLKYENGKAKLVLATWNEDDEGNRTYSLTPPIDYQKELNLFAMPFDFIWAITVTTSSPNFAYDLANLAIDDDSEIIITVFDVEKTHVIEKTEQIEVEEDTDAETSESGEQVTEEAETEETVVEEVDTETSETEETDSETTETEEVTTYTFYKENTVHIAVTEANTWLLKYNVDDCGVTVDTTIDEHGIEIRNGTFNQGNPRIIEKLDKNSETENFVTLFNKRKYVNARKNLISASGWLYEILAESEDTVEMIDTVKYILYCATEDETMKTDIINWQELAYLGDLSANDSSNYVGTGEFWWPIGSMKTKEINGKLFATGEPALGAESISRAGIESSPYHGIAAYGTYHPIGTAGSAVDIGAGGKTDYYYVISIGKGYVTRVQNGNIPDGQKIPEVGNCVTVNYDGLEVRYMHLYAGSIEVSEGDIVDYGQVIGKIGNSGNSSGAHLHIDMKMNGEPVDTTEYINPNNPRASRLYEFILRFEGGEKYRSGEDYVVFNNGADNCLEVTGGLVICFDKNTGVVRSEFAKVLGTETIYKAGDIITKAQYEECFKIMKDYLDGIIERSCGESITLTQAQHDAIFTIGYRKTYCYGWIS